jgi:hypothetical protein
MINQRGQKSKRGGSEMKRKNVLLTATILFSAILVLMGCGGNGNTAGGGDTNSLLSMLPADANSVMAFNFNKFAQTGFYDKMIEKSKGEQQDNNKTGFENYQEFIAKTGIDPKKDIHMAVIGVTGGAMPGTPGSNAVVVAQGNFTADKLLGFIKAEADKEDKSEGSEITESDYNGIKMFSGVDRKGEGFAFSILKDGIMTFGSSDGVKKAIDVAKGAANLLSNEGLKSHLDKLNSGAVFSMVSVLPDEFKKVHDSGPFKFDMSKAEALTATIDRDGSSWALSITLVSHNEEGNNEIVAKLNGFKMMGAALGPEVGELINNIELFSSAHDVTLKVTVSDSLVDKLEKKIASGGLMGRGGQL